MRLALFAICAAAAAGAPLVPTGGREAPATASIPWPRAWEGRALKPIAATAEDRLLARDFPGSVARFSDGSRQIVLRRTAAPTRRLHPASDCFRGAGYAVSPAPMQAGPGRPPASCFLATRDGRTFRVCERIESVKGASWPDVSSWYWAALLDSGSGPWLAALTVEPIAAGE